MRYVKAAAAILVPALILALLFSRGRQARQSHVREARAQALAAAAPEGLKARYVLEQLSYASPDSTAPELRALGELLKARGWVQDAQPMAWSRSIRKGAFFRHGWVWVGDESAKTLKSVWYEPDLKAGGMLQWSEDGTQLRIRADGWRRWMNLDLELNP